MVLQNYQNFIELTSNMIYIVALGVGMLKYKWNTYLFTFSFQKLQYGFSKTLQVESRQFPWFQIEPSWYFYNCVSSHHLRWQATDQPGQDLVLDRARDLPWVTSSIWVFYTALDLSLTTSVELFGPPGVQVLVWHHLKNKSSKSLS